MIFRSFNLNPVIDVRPPDRGACSFTLLGMTKVWTMKLKILALLICFFAASLHHAWSAVIARIEENGGGVLASYSGSIDLVGLRLYSTNPVPSFGYQNVQADSGRFGIGGSASFLRYSGLLGPRTIGSASLQYIPTSVTGEFAGIWGNIGHIWVPLDYISDSQISGTSSWSGRSLASLGLSVGEYTWTWGSGASGDSFTLLIVPEPSCVHLLWLGALSLILHRHRCNRSSNTVVDNRLPAPTRNDPLDYNL